MMMQMSNGRIGNAPGGMVGNMPGGYMPGARSTMPGMLGIMSGGLMGGGMPGEPMMGSFKFADVAEVDSKLQLKYLLKGMLSWKVIISIASYKTDGLQVGGDHWCVLIMDTISFQCPLCTPLTSSLYDLQLI